MTDESEKTEAEKQILELIKESHARIREAMVIADSHALAFNFEPEHIGTYYGKGNPGRYGDEEIALGMGEWYPSSWSSSSIYC